MEWGRGAYMHNMYMHMHMYMDMYMLYMLLCMCMQAQEHERRCGNMQRHMRASARDGAPVLLLEVLVDLAAARAHVDDPHARA